jgi:hypothetical protein
VMSTVADFVPSVKFGINTAVPPSALPGCRTPHAMLLIIASISCEIAREF